MIAATELELLEEHVEAALRGTPDGLTLLGHGEISLVLGWPADNPRMAAKRLPLFADARALEAYRAILSEYLQALEETGVQVAATELHQVRKPCGKIAAYCVQELLPADSLAPRVLRAADPAQGHPLVQAIVAATARTVSARVGLDAQLSNWAWSDDGPLVYLDITTPLLADDDGQGRLDPDLFLAAFPWLLRGSLKRWVIPGLLRRYHALRSVLLDLCANLIKERLNAWMPAFLAAANRHLDKPLSAAEAERDYRSDARLWEVMLRLRRLDRAWQRHVRRRVYPFLLPQAIAR